jgi:GTP cyclohydrolase I
MDKIQEQKIKDIEKHFKEIMRCLSLDVVNDPELKDTPRRVAKMYVTELFSGLDKANEPKMTVFPNKVGYNQIISLTNIKVASMCAHHFLSFPLEISIGYIPNKTYVGISKLARVAEYFSRRPTTQEILVHNIADYIEKHLQPLGLIVFARGQHLCMGVRGIQKPDAVMVTSEVRGLFRENLELETKFLNMIEKK